MNFTYLKPKFFSVMKNYSAGQFTKDVIAGIIVAIIALPLSIALALASGVEPACGIYTAIAAGFCVSLLGGSRIQIAGPTAALPPSWRASWPRRVWTDCLSPPCWRA